MTLDQAGHLVYGTLLTKETKMKVEPKQLVVVTVVGRIMFIAAEGAGRDWVEQGAPQFGAFFNDRPGEYTLFPRKTFDVEEVRAYLESVGQEGT
jgi:hypothetical protein